MALTHINEFYTYAILPISILNTYKLSLCESSSKCEVADFYVSMLLLGTETQRGQQVVNDRVNSNSHCLIPEFSCLLMYWGEKGSCGLNLDQQTFLFKHHFGAHSYSLAI